MRKRILSGILTFSIILSLFTVLSISVGALPSYKTGTTSSSNVYCLPDNTSSMLIGSVGSESVKVYWAEGNSYYIEYVVNSGAYSGYKRGYIPKTKVSVSGVGSIGYTARNAKTTANTKVYNRSTTSSLSIGTIYSTDTIKIMQEDGSWYYIQYPISGGYKRGYIPKTAGASSGGGGGNITSSTYGNMGWTYPISDASTFRKLSNGFKSGHKAIDIISNTSTSINGQTIKSPAAGTVKYSNWDDTAGYTIIIESSSVDPANNHKIRFGIQHMQAKSSYSKDQTVSKGATLGKVGTTGSSSTGYHLHLYMRSDDNLWTNASGRSINPQVFFPGVSFTGATSSTLYL